MDQDTITANDRYDSDTMQHYHGEEGDGPGSVVIHSNNIDQKCCPTDESWKESSSKHHLFDPFLTYKYVQGAQ